MKMTQFADFANNATKQILGISGLIRENLQSMFSYPNAINVLDSVTVSGRLIHIDDSAPLNAKHVTVYIEPLQEGNGEPSPNNIRPISGWTKININANGSNIPVTLPDDAGTIYGGILDITNGVLTVDMAILQTTWGDGLNIEQGSLINTVRKRFPINPTDRLKKSMCNIATFQYNYNIDTVHYYVSGSGTNANAYVFLPVDTDNSTSIQIAYTLIEPQIYTLTPTNILLLNGNNTIYADCGSMELEYYRREGGGSPYV